jgi:hypothetical protein
MNNETVIKYSFPMEEDQVLVIAHSLEIMIDIFTKFSQEASNVTDELREHLSVAEDLKETFDFMITNESIQ